MGDLIDNIFSLIKEYKNNPEKIIAEEVEKINSALSKLNFSQSNKSVYFNIQQKKDNILSNPKKFIEEEIESLYLTAIDIDETLYSMQKYKAFQINQIRANEIFKDVKYTFPDGMEDYIQFRDDNDRANIQDIVTKAQIEVINGNPNKINYFMPKSNQMKQMTSQEILILGNYLIERGERMFQISWIHKKNINELKTKEEILNYDLNSLWEE